MVCYHGINRFQGWLVFRGGQEAPGCRRKAWNKVCSVVVSFCRGPDRQRHFRWSVVASLVETRNSGRESPSCILWLKDIDVCPCRMRKAVARYAEPCYRQEVSATSHKFRIYTYFTSTSAWSAEEVWSNIRSNNRHRVHCFKIRTPNY